MSTHQIEWIDGEREPQSPPNPNYPDGIDIDIARDAALSCLVKLPYPAKRCGYFLIVCSICGLRTGITTAGRPDDPRSVKLPCQLEGRA